MEFGGHIGQLIIGAFYSYMYESELKNKKLIETLSNIHDKYIMVPVDIRPLTTSSLSAKSVTLIA